MNILGGLDRPSAGRVWVDGYDLLKMSDFGAQPLSPRQGRLRLAAGRAQPGPLSERAGERRAADDLGRARPGASKRQRAEELLDAVGLAERRHHHLPQLSGGEQQRVAIAVALANSPTLLLADEPTGEVDTATALTIYQTFQELNRDYGLTTLIVSHDHGHRPPRRPGGRHPRRQDVERDGAPDGRRSPDGSETGSRQKRQAAEEQRFEELVVVDSAGRLQVPKEYLQQFGIKGRVRLELREGGS